MTLLWFFFMVFFMMYSVLKPANLSISYFKYKYTYDVDI